MDYCGFVCVCVCAWEVKVFPLNPTTTIRKKNEPQCWSGVPEIIPPGFEEFEQEQKFFYFVSFIFFFLSFRFISPDNDRPVSARCFKSLGNRLFVTKCCMLHIARTEKIFCRRIDYNGPMGSRRRNRSPPFPSLCHQHRRLSLFVFPDWIHPPERRYASGGTVRILVI